MNSFLNLLLNSLLSFLINFFETFVFPIDGPQKQLAASYASNDWIFSLDADERVEDDLIGYVKKLDLANSDFMSYSFKRRNY